MQVQKTRFTKMVLMLLAGFSLSCISVNQLQAREKEAAAAAANKTGVASWYGGDFHGRKTASGEVYNMHQLSCASNQYPLGTWLRVTNTRNGKAVVVQVNDRMHPRCKRVVDLSKGAAKEIGLVKRGICNVKIENLGK